MKLIVARHCQTDWNARSKVQGCTDIPLNAAGYAQAVALADKLVGSGVSKIVTSDLSRALETSNIIACRLSVPIVTDPRLRECSFGLVEGMPFGLFQLLFGGMHGKPLPNKLSYDFRLFGGELGLRVAIRYMQAVFDIVRQGPRDATVMIVGHGRALRTLFAALSIDERCPPQGDFLTLEF